MKNVIAILVVLFLAAGAWAGWMWRQHLLWGRQIRNLELSRSYSRALEAHLEEHGAYPSSLISISETATWSDVAPGSDIWGHPFAYYQSGDHFVLVSAGRGGELDFDSYDRFMSIEPAVSDICFDWSADQIMSDQGWHQVCGK